MSRSWRDWWDKERGQAGTGGSHHRLIPAHAGNAEVAKVLNDLAAAHPRACGERSSARSNSVNKCGSSPRMRGTRRHPRSWVRIIRLIPAHAGNARSACSSPPRHTAHPRACGERSIAAAAPTDRGGSSPRMRGTRVRRRLHREYQRLIPAHAGNALTRSKAARASSAHPRACGERTGWPFSSGP